MVQELQRLGIPIDAVSSVSGGSIFASFLATGGTSKEFVEAVRQGDFDLKREVLNVFTASRLLAGSRVVGPYQIAPIEFSMTHVQAAMLDRLFLGGVKLRALKGKSPALLLCTTDLDQLELVGITATGLVRRPLSVPAERIRTLNWVAPSYEEPSYYQSFRIYDVGPETLSEAVAASGAFPGAFRPLRLAGRGDEDVPEANDSSWGTLADGGIADNLGLLGLMAARERAELVVDPLVDPLDTRREDLVAFNIDVAIASDASALPRRENMPCNRYSALSGSPLPGLKRSPASLNPVEVMDVAEMPPRLRLWWTNSAPVGTPSCPGCGRPQPGGKERRQRGRGNRPPPRISTAPTASVVMDKPYLYR